MERGEYGKRIGDKNKILVLHMLRYYPGIRGSEISKMTGLGTQAVSRHVRSIRSEWKKTPKRELKK